ALRIHHVAEALQAAFRGEETPRANYRSMQERIAVSPRKMAGGGNRHFVGVQEAQFARVGILRWALQELAVGGGDRNAQRFAAQNQQVATVAKVTLDAAPSLGGNRGAVREHE